MSCFRSRSRFRPSLEVLESRLALDGKVNVVTAVGSAILLGDDAANQVQIAPVPDQPGKFTITGLNGTQIQLNKNAAADSVVVENVQRFGGTLAGGNDSIEANDLQGLKEFKIDTGKGQNEVSLGGTNNFTKNVEITGDNNKVNVTGDTTIGGDLKIGNGNKTGTNETNLATTDGDKLNIGGSFSYRTQTKGDAVDTFKLGNDTQRGVIGKDAVLNSGGGAANVFLNNFDVNGKIDITTQNGDDKVDGDDVTAKKGAKINGKNGNDVLSLNNFSTEASLAFDTGLGTGNQVNLTGTTQGVNASFRGENNIVSVTGNASFSGSFSVLNTGKGGANTMNLGTLAGDTFNVGRALSINSFNNGAGSNTITIGNSTTTTTVGANTTITVKSGNTSVNIKHTTLEDDLRIRAKDAVFQQAIFDAIQANEMRFDAREAQVFSMQNSQLASNLKAYLGKANVELEDVTVGGKTRIQTTVPGATFTSFLINDCNFTGAVDLVFLGAGLGSFLLETFTTAANVATQFLSNLTITSGKGELDGAMGFKDVNGVTDPNRQVTVSGNLKGKGGKGEPNLIRLGNVDVTGSSDFDSILTT